jgi:iron-sulfur cluster assembly protein
MSCKCYTYNQQGNRRENNLIFKGVKMTEQKQITREMTIGEILEKYPGSADVMESYGLHCIGCDVNPFDTLGNAARVHEMPEDKMNSLQNDLNKLEMGEEKIVEEVKNPVISLTDNAAKKVLELMKSNGMEGGSLHFGLVAGGCAGSTYSLEFVKESKNDDIELEDKGVKILVDRSSIASVNNTTIDYLDSLQQSGFKINNPNAKATCGCGKSASM